MECLILASGFGTRLYPVTIERAKPLLEYRGKPVLTHIVDRVPSSLAVSVCTNRKFEKDFSRWQETATRKLEICVEDVWTPEQRKGAVGSLSFWVKSKAITNDLLVIAGDNYFEFDLNEFIKAYDGKNVLVAVHDIKDKARARHLGVVQLNGDRIVELEEKPAHPRSSLVATACYILPPSTFGILAEYCSLGRKDNLGNFIAYLVSRQTVKAYLFTESWLDIGNV